MVFRGCGGLEAGVLSSSSADSMLCVAALGLSISSFVSVVMRTVLLTGRLGLSAILTAQVNALAEVSCEWWVGLANTRSRPMIWLWLGRDASASTVLCCPVCFEKTPDA